MNEDRLTKTDFGRILDQPIVTEMKDAYVDYAMSVIVARALPDVRDGLKPVQRRILYAMSKLGISSSSAHKKSARIIGDVIGKYHPHGDQAVYDAMVRMAQEFSLRYPLVDGQGNFGSVDGDPPAAMRYTEARLTKLSEELLEDLNKNTVDLRDNFDGNETEPHVLPAKLPNLLLNGADGIAVGMATKIAPHNLGEIVDALVFLIEKADIEVNKDGQMAKWLDGLEKVTKDITRHAAIQPFNHSQLDYFGLDAGEITVNQLMQRIPGPDFPTGGEIYNQKEIEKGYTTGKGRVLTRAKANIIEIGQGKNQINVTELPYQQNKAQLIAKIAGLVRDDKITDISDLRDASDRRGIKIEIELKKTATPQKVLNQLYKFTPMQQSYYMNMVGLVNGEPKVLTLKTILTEYLGHRRDVIIRRSIHDLNQNVHRAHILEGLKIALDNIDEIITTIRESKTQEAAKENLITNFELSEIQAQAILEMQLRRLAGLERQKVLDELGEVTTRITELATLLKSPQKIMQTIREELENLKETYGDKRRTKVYKGKPGEITEEELIKEEETVIVLSRGGYIKRVSPQSFKAQGRGGKGVRGGKLKEEDVIFEVQSASTHDEVLFFTNEGKVYSVKAWDIPEMSRTARGTPVVNLIQVSGEEKVTSVLVKKNTKS